MKALLLAKDLMRGGGGAGAPAVSEHMFRLDLGVKDTRLAVELAEALGVDWAIGKKTFDLLNEGMARGYGLRNISEYTNTVVEETGSTAGAVRR